MTGYEEALRYCNEKLEKEVAALKAQIKKLQQELQKASKV
jgi:cell division protein FtsB